MANPRKAAFIQAIHDTMDKDEKTTYQALETAKENLRFYESVDSDTIYTAIKCENEWAVKWLCKRFKEAFPNDDQGFSPLDRAVEYKDLGRAEEKEEVSPQIKKRREIVATLAAHYSVIPTKSFERAVHCNNFYFLDVYDKARTQCVWTLKQAVIDNNVDAVKRIHELKKISLIAEEGCPELKDYYDFLEYSIMQRQIEIALFLIKHGFLINDHYLHHEDKILKYLIKVFLTRELNKEECLLLFNALIAPRTDGIEHHLGPYILHYIHQPEHFSRNERIDMMLKLIPLLDFNQDDGGGFFKYVWPEMEAMNNEEVFISLLLHFKNGWDDYTGFIEQYKLKYRPRFEYLVSTGQLEYIKRLHKINVIFPWNVNQFNPAANTQGVHEYLRGRDLILLAGDPNLRLAPDQAATHLQKMNPVDAIDLLDACLACEEMTQDLYDRLRRYVKPLEIPAPPPAPVVRLNDPTLSAFAEQKRTFFNSPGDSKQEVTSESETLELLRKALANEDFWKDYKVQQEMLKDMIASKSKTNQMS